MSQQLETAFHYQTGLFTALVGLLTAKGVFSRDEMAAALEVVASQEPNAIASQLLGILAEHLVDGHSTPEEVSKFQVILGGLQDREP